MLWEYVDSLLTEAYWYMLVVGINVGTQVLRVYMPIVGAKKQWILSK